MKSVFVYLFLLFTLTLSSQRHWECIILASDNWKYFPATSEPDANWNQTSFNDDSWAQGPGGIGYSDGDDSTVISPVNSLYLRRTFNISDISIIEQLLLHIDYDDAFVAYLNGVEVARSYNIIVENPLYNSDVTEWREAQMWMGGYPERYELESDDLVNGDNLLALQILNYNGTNSSDLSSIIFLSAQINSETIIYNNTPYWFYEPIIYPDVVELTQSNLPVIVINTNGQNIADDPKITAQMGIIYNGEGITNNISDNYNNYDGLIAIEIRGESSQMFPKKSFLLETRDEFGENNNVSLLNMPAENDWILYAPYSDKSMLRNSFTFWMGQQTYDYCPRTAYCELILNGEYQGVYVLMEKIKRDNNRVDIGTLNSFEISGDDVTGGYIIRVDKRDEGYQDQVDGWTEPSSSRYPNAKDIEYQFFYPDAKDIVDEQRTYIKNYISDVEDILVDPNFDDHENGYNKYINIGSFIDFLLISELAKEVDNYRFSTYFYKKKESNGNELFAGPLWDFNLGYANVDYWPPGLDTEGWMYEDVQPNPWSVMFWWKRLMEDPYFENLVTTRWKYLRENQFSDTNIQNVIDSLTSHIHDAQQRNYTQWPILGTYVWPNYDWVGNNYADEVEFFEDWLYQRLYWMDDNLNSFILNPSGLIEIDEDYQYDNSIKLQLTLVDDYFNNPVIDYSGFSLDIESENLYIYEVEYVSTSEAELYVYDNTGNPDKEITVTVSHEILNGFQDITTNSITSTDDFIISDTDIKIYYSNNNIVIRCNKPNYLPEYIEVYNSLGQLMGTYDLHKQTVNTIATNLPASIYHVRLVVNKNVISESIIISGIK